MTPTNRDLFFAGITALVVLVTVLIVIVALWNLRS